MSREPIADLEDGVAWYFEGKTPRSKVTHEGAIAIYPGWVRLGAGPSIPTWVPRDRVEQVHER